MDNRIRGLTHAVNDVKHYIDRENLSIQNLMSDDINLCYLLMDVNVYKENIFHTKMLLQNFGLKHACLT